MKKIISIIILLISNFTICNLCFGIGQVTEPIVFKGVLRGQSIEDKLILLNSAEDLITYKLSAEGDIQDWTEFYGENNTNQTITEISVLATSTVNCIAKFNVPKDAPNGEYKGQVIITNLPQKNEITGETSASVSLRIGRDVSITVTDQEIIDFNTAVIPVKYAVANGDSMKIKIIYENQGNIIIKPSIDLKILKGDVTIFNAIYPYPEGDEGVKPFARKIIPYIEWPTGGQENGSYQAKIKVLFNDVVNSEHQINFEVGHDISWYLATFANFGPNKLGIILIGIGVVLMGIFFVRTFVFKKKDWEKPMNFVRSLLS